MNIEWIKLTKDNKPEGGIEFLLYNEKWINEDYNPKGIRVGFWDDITGWTSAYWCNCHDEYHTRISEEDDDHFELNKKEDQIPTYFTDLPDSP